MIMGVRLMSIRERMYQFGVRSMESLSNGAPAIFKGMVVLLAPGNGQMRIETIYESRHDSRAG